MLGINVKLKFEEVFVVNNNTGKLLDEYCETHNLVLLKSTDSHRALHLKLVDTHSKKEVAHGTNVLNYFLHKECDIPKVVKEEIERFQKTLKLICCI